MVLRILAAGGFAALGLSCAMGRLRTRDGSPTQIRPVGCYTVDIEEWPRSGIEIQFPKRIVVSSERDSYSRSAYQYRLDRADGRPMGFDSGRWWIAETQDSVVLEWGMHNPEGFDGVI